MSKQKPKEDSIEKSLEQELTEMEENLPPINVQATKAETPMIAQQEDIPRFVLSITDTQTVIANQYYSINVGVDNIDDLNRLIPKKKRTNDARTELQNVLLHFKQAVADFDNKPFEAEVVSDEDAKA